MARIVTVSGPAAGKTFRLTKVITLGRSRNLDISFDDLSVSREHARILVNSDGDYVLEDLQSGNGTLLNGKRITSAKLSEGDAITVGKNVMVFRGLARPAAVAAADDVILEVSEGAIARPQVAEADLAGHEPRTAGRTVEFGAADRRLRLVCETFQSVGTGLNEDRLLARILNALFDAFPDTSRGFIILRDAQTGTLRARAAKILQDDAGKKVTISRTVLEHVVRKREPVLSDDAMRDARFDDSPSIFSVGVRSVMCAPLLYRDKVFGFILLDTQEVSEHYNEEGLAVLSAVTQLASLVIANARLHSRLIERERMEHDLRNAARIQRNFLPQELPKVEGYEFADWYRAAHQVGGDFYDFIPMPDGNVAIVIGDVSGKGIAAALMMGQVMAHVRFAAAAGRGAGETLGRINKAIMGAVSESFVTLLYMVLGCRSRRVVIANAGHWPPLVRRADGRVVSIELSDGLPIGVAEGQFSETVVELGPLDCVCAFTDGVTDAINEKRESYGVERLRRILAECPPSPEAMVKSVQEAVLRHMGAAEQGDDVALVCFGPAGTGQGT